MTESRPPVHPDSDGDAARVASTMAEWLEQCASFRIAVRDGEGRFVETGSARERTDFFSVDERHGVIGATDWPTMRYLDADGRELRLLDHPAHVARLSGQPQIGKLIGLRSPTGDTRWYFGDYIPMRPSGAGYEVISVVMDATEARIAREDLEARAGALEVLLTTSIRLAEVIPELPEVAATLREAIEIVVPQTHAIVAVQDSNAGSFRSSMITELPGMMPAATSTPATPDVRTLLTATHVNNDVQLTNIYGTRVTGADEVPARSFCMVPVRQSDEVVGAIGAYAQTPNYFGPERVILLEWLARLTGPVLTTIVRRAAHRAAA